MVLSPADIENSYGAETAHKVAMQIFAEGAPAPPPAGPMRLIEAKGSLTVAGYSRNAVAFYVQAISKWFRKTGFFWRESEVQREALEYGARSTKSVRDAENAHGKQTGSRLICWRGPRVRHRAEDCARAFTHICSGFLPHSADFVREVTVYSYLRFGSMSLADGKGPQVATESLLKSWK